MVFHTLLEDIGYFAKCARAVIFLVVFLENGPK